MNNYGTIYRYELKKIISKKIVWISFLLGILVSIVSVFAPLLGNYYIDGKFIDTNWHMYQTDKKYALELSGRKIDQALLEETVAAFGKSHRPRKPTIRQRKNIKNMRVHTMRFFKSFAKQQVCGPLRPCIPGSRMKPICTPEGRHGLCPAGRI